MIIQQKENYSFILQQMFPIRHNHHSVDGLFFGLEATDAMLSRESVYGMNPKKSQVSMPCWRCVNLDMAGQAKFGPDVEWVDSPDRLSVDPRRGDAFYAEVRKYWPALQDGSLAPGYAGIRPKISGPHEAAADFCIQGQATHGIPGLVNLFGIESPGLTSALAIGEHVAKVLVQPTANL